jgi:hypothetical protein
MKSWNGIVPRSWISATMTFFSAVFSVDDSNSDVTKAMVSPDVLYLALTEKLPL